MPAPASPYGNNAKDLKGTVPNEAISVSGMFDDLMESAPSPKATPAPSSIMGAVQAAAQNVQGKVSNAVTGAQQALTAPGGAVSVQGMFDDLVGDEGPSIGPAEEQLNQEDPGFWAGLIPANFTAEGWRQQKEIAPYRALVSVATKDSERRDMLHKLLGPENVRVHYKGEKSDGEFSVRMPGDKKWRKFDADTLELGADLADMFRGAAEEVITLPFEMKGTAAGAAAGGPAAPVTGTVGFAVGRTVGGAVANRTMEMYKQYLLGDKSTPPPLLDATSEDMIAGASRALMGFVGDKFAGLIAKQAAKPAAKANHEAIAESAQESLTAAKELAEQGYFSMVPGGNAALMVHQIDPRSPIAQQYIRKYGELPEMRIALEQQGKAYHRNMINILQDAAQVTNKGPVPEESLASAMRTFSKDMRAAEGKAIGEYRMRAQVATKNQPVKLSQETANTVSDLMNSLGFRIKSGVVDEATGRMGPAKLVPPSADEVAGTLNLKTTGAARNIINVVQQVGERLNKKGLTLSSLDEAIELFSGQYKTVAKNGGEAYATYARTLSALRAERNRLISEALPESERAGFAKTVKRFGDITSAQTTLANTMKEDVANQVFVNSIFTEGAKGLPRMQAAKTLLAEDHPEVWTMLKKNYVDQLITTYTKSDLKYTTQFDAAGFSQHIKGLPREMQELIFDNPKVGVDNIKKLALLGERMNHVDFTALSKDEQAKMLNALAQGTQGILAKSFYMLIKGVGATGRIISGKRANNSFVETLQNEGVDKFMGKIAEKDRGRMRKLLTGLVDEFVATQEARAKYAPEMFGKANDLFDASGTGVKATIKKGLNATIPNRATTRGAGRAAFMEKVKSAQGRDLRTPLEPLEEEQ